MSVTFESMSDSERTPGGALQDLIVSGIRLQAGLLMYGIERLQDLSNVAGKGQGPQGLADEAAATLNSLTGFLETGLDRTKKDALKSVSRVASKAVAKSAEVLSKAADFYSGTSSDRDSGKAV
jgi:hypothetical protein